MLLGHWLDIGSLDCKWSNGALDGVGAGAAESLYLR